MHAREYRGGSVAEAVSPRLRGTVRSTEEAAGKCQPWPAAVILTDLTFYSRVPLTVTDAIGVESSQSKLATSCHKTTYSD